MIATGFADDAKRDSQSRTTAAAESDDDGTKVISLDRWKQFTSPQEGLDTLFDQSELQPDLGVPAVLRQRRAEHGSR